MYFDITDTGYTIAYPDWRIGLCSGTTDIPGDVTPTNAVGVKMGAAFGGAWNYYNGGANNIVHSNIKWIPFKQVAGVLTGGADFGGLSHASVSGLANGNGTPVFVDIIKGSPNYTMQVWAQNATVSSVTPAAYLQQVNNVSPVLTGCVSLGTQPLAFSESGGTLDAGFHYWNTGYPPVRIRDWRVLRLA